MNDTEQATEARHSPEPWEAIVLALEAFVEAFGPVERKPFGPKRPELYLSPVAKSIRAEIAVQAKAALTGLEPSLEQAIDRLEGRIEAWVMNKVEAKFDVEWDISVSEERELKEVIRVALAAVQPTKEAGT